MWLLPLPLKNVARAPSVNIHLRENGLALHHAAVARSKIEWIEEILRYPLLHGEQGEDMVVGDCTCGR